MQCEPRARLPAASLTVSQEERDSTPSPAGPEHSCGGERAAITHHGKNEMLENSRRQIQGWDGAQIALLDARAQRCCSSTAQEGCAS